ncbi:MAG: rod shape-determining protein MreC [Terriglobales bacterium]
MESVFGRYRNLVVLVGVLFVQILGLAVQVRRARTQDSEPTRLIRVWAVGAVTPLEKLLSWAQTSSGNVWHNYFYLRGVRAENRELKHEIEQMRIERARITQDADQAHRLQALLGFKEQFISQTVAAQVIGGSGSELSRSVYIDKGEHDGIKPDMAVLTRDGIVGKVLRVYRSTALVLLIDDQTSGVGSILEKSRLQGILRGTSSGEVVLEKVMSDETVPEGEQVLTSGGDGIFPKGLTVGTVTKVKPGSDLFLNIHVRPAADLNRLEEVLVVTKVDEKQTQPDQMTSARAVDILAERLPTVPPKPDAAKAGQTPAGGKPGAQNLAAPAGASQKPGTDKQAQKSGDMATTGSAKANQGASKVSATSAQGTPPNPQPAVVKKSVPPASPSTTGTVATTSSTTAKSATIGASSAGNVAAGNVATGNTAAPASSPTTPGNSTTGVAKKPAPKRTNPGAPAAVPKSQRATEGPPQ